MPALRTITSILARRLAITRQRLAGPPAEPTPEGMLDLVRDLRCLQLDPISAVARSHLLVLWSRLGAYDPAHLDTLLWRERRLFEYWAHCASIVLTEDYPIHNVMMRSHAAGDSGWQKRERDWLEANRLLHDQVLAQIQERGPLLGRTLEDQAAESWHSTGWTSGRNVSRMLDFLWLRGTIMVAGRSGGQKLWDLTECCLPEWTPTQLLDRQEATRCAVPLALRALGVARPKHIQDHFIRGRYHDLPGVLRQLEAAGEIVPVQIQDDGHALPGPWYVHAADLPLLERLESGDWCPRTTLLSPFDNLICDRARTELLFDFRFRIEIYVPKPKREYGYYVLPILHGDRLIGRIDPLMDRKAGRLVVNAIYAEPHAPASHEAVDAVATAVEQLAAFLGARQIDYAGNVPAAWECLRRS